jgi:hypothetical protein
MSASVTPSARIIDVSDVRRDSCDFVIAVEEESVAMLKEMPEE